MICYHPSGTSTVPSFAGHGAPSHQDAKENKRKTVGHLSPSTTPTDGKGFVDLMRITVLPAGRKERTYPELVRPGSRARFVVLAGEIGGRWFVETKMFLSQLALARSREEISLMQRGSHVPLRGLSPLHFWNSDVHMVRMVKVPPSHEVDAEFRCGGLA